MKANELRIGNKLQKSNGEIYTILRLDNTTDVLVCEQRGLLTLDYNLFGIPLTKEWLLKLGFKKLEKIVFSKKIDLHFSIFINKNLCFIGYHDRPESDIQLRNVEFVHQLQNLYFALTGEELIIKENEDTNQ